VTLDEPLLLRIRSCLAAGPAVRLAVLFGSRATGRARADSDFDIGVVPVHDLTLAEELSMASALSGATGVEVDLVRLDGDDPLLGNEVARNGVCLFEAEPGVFAAYRAMAVSRWIEWDELVAPYREAFLRRAAAGVGR